MIKKSKKSVLFLGKKKDDHCLRALEFCQSLFDEVSAYMSKYGDPFPEDLGYLEYDYIVSYLSRWIVPEYVLKKARIAAINFHPASPEYPGIGCNNFALYENASEYGVTCHHMKAKVDTGDIIAVKRFPVLESDTVDTILKRTYDFQLVLFYEVAAIMAKEDSLPSSSEVWTRKPFTRKEFNKLFSIEPDMSKQEVENRIRAVSYREYQPSVNIFGHSFELKPK